MTRKTRTLLLTGFLLAILSNPSCYGQDEKSQLEGRWDMVITNPDKKLPSWLEIRHSGTHTLIGRFVYAFGSARPISEVKVTNGRFRFSIPPQWEPGTSDLEFEGRAQGDSLKGTLRYTDGKMYNWVASRAPMLHRKTSPTWGKPTTLFDGKDLKGWHSEKNPWTVESGILKSPKPGSNLVTDQAYTDFKLHIEFRYQKGGNSGVYLRGRYEVQITDSKGMEAADNQFGGVYGFLEPNEMVAKDAGEWQSFDITFIGRRVTIIANGITVINDQVIPGITGGALDSKEGEPGPIMLQGDHEPIEYRNIVITTPSK